MTNEEWCRTVLERVFPKSTIPSQPLPPALYGIAGKIWRDWQQMKGFTQTTDVFARNNPSFPPDPMWLAKVAVSAGWRTLTTQSFDPWFRTRCIRQYGLEFRIAAHSNYSVDDLLKL
jgi:hypothetical protein